MKIDATIIGSSESVLNQPGLIIDLFAGGGGASLGMEMALGRAVDLAVNHSPEAVAIHLANHPSTHHYIQSIYQVNPYKAVASRPVDVLWGSPDCKHFSKAKGTAPKDRNIRELGWALVPWIRASKPKLVCVENVEEFLTWGPLDSKGKPIKELAGTTFRRWVKAIEREGYRVDWRLLRACDYGAPTIRRRLFVVARRDRKPINWPEPTHGPDRAEPWRTAAECIDWSIPVPSIFGRKKPLAENTLKRIAEGLRRYVLQTSAPFIVELPENVFSDEPWIIPAESGLVAPLSVEIGGNDRQACPLPMNRPFKTLLTHEHKALAMGNLVPFIQHVQHGGNGKAGVMSAADPLRTITAYPKGGGMALVAANLVHYYGTKAGGRPRCGDLADPFRTATAAGNRFGLMAATLVQTGYGERPGQLPRVLGLAKPLGTVVAGGGKHALVASRLAPFLAGAGGPEFSGKPVMIDKPMGTLTAENHRALVTAYLSHFYGTMQDGCLVAPMKTITSGGQHSGLVSVFLSQYYGQSVGSAIYDPVRTLTRENKSGLIAAFLSKYYGTAFAEPLSRPMSTITSHEKLALTTAFLAKYYGKSTCHSLLEPVGTLTTKERYGLVTVRHIPLVWVEGQPYVIADIGLRMLTPRELARAQGFPDDYNFKPMVRGKRLTQKAQVAAIGNSVPPQFADALIRANLKALDYVPRPKRRRRETLFLAGLEAYV